jgi:hypothetical protein
MAAKTPEERPGSMREVGAEVRALAGGLGVELDDRPLPALSAVQLEAFIALPAGADVALGAADTHRRLYARPDLLAKAGPARTRARRMPLAAASVVTALAVGGAAVGLYGFVTKPEPIPAPVAQQETVAPSLPPPVTETTSATPSETISVEAPPPPPSRTRTTARRTTARRAVEPPPPPPPPPPTATVEPTTEPPATEPPVEVTDTTPPDDGSEEVGRVLATAEPATGFVIEQVPIIPIVPDSTTSLPRGRIIPAQ